MHLQYTIVGNDIKLEVMLFCLPDIGYASHVWNVPCHYLGLTGLQIAAVDWR